MMATIITDDEESQTNARQVGAVQASFTWRD